MVNEVIYVIGVTATERGQLWRRAIERIETVTPVDIPTRDFTRQIKPEIEVMATSMVCVRLGWEAPKRGARSYHFSAGEGYAPLVVVPPVLDPKCLPEELKRVLQDSGTEDIHIGFRCRGYDVALYIWKTLNEELIRELDQRTGGTCRVGFHCETIGYWGESEEEDIRAFAQSHQQFVQRLRSAGVSIGTQ